MTLFSFTNNKSIAIKWVIAALSSLVCASGYSQEPDSALMHRISREYKNENAVYTHFKEKLEITYEDGELKATTYTNTQRLLISDLSPSFDHYDFVGDNYLDQVTQFDAIAYVPKADGGYKKEVKPYMFRAGAGGGGISDASNIVTSFVGLKKGSVVDLTATQEHPELIFLPGFIAGERYPILHAEYVVELPKFVNIKFVFKGENTSMFHQSKEEKNGKIIYKFTADNIKAYKSIEGVPSALYYYPQIINFITSFRLPGQQKDSLFLSDAEHLYKQQYKFIRNLNIKEDTGIRKVVDRITKGDKTDREKAQHIYEWVQHTFQYKAFEVGLGGWVPREADTVCKKKYGDCKDMASVLVTMGRMAGLKTYFTWIGTTLLPYTFEETPVPYVCNHMICALQIDNEWLFMDGTHPYLPFGTNRDDIQGKEAMVSIDKDHYKILTIPTVDASKNVTTDSTRIKLSNENIQDVVGNVHMRLSGFSAWNDRYRLPLYSSDQDEKEKAINALTERGSKQYKLDKFDLRLNETGNKDVNVSANFNLTNYATKIGNSLMINLNLLNYFNHLYVDTTDRTIGYYNDFKKVRKEVVVFDIPEGYKVNYLPKDKKENFKDLWDYSISYKTNGKTITLTKDYRISSLVVNKKDILANNAAIKELEKQYDESVVLISK